MTGLFIGARALLDLVAPQECAGCRRPGELLCPACLRELTADLDRRDPTPSPVGLPPVFSSARYLDPARQALLAYKERGCVALAGPLGQALALATGLAVSETLSHRERGAVLGLVPVPSSRAAVRARGHDHMPVLARRAAKALTGAGLPSTAVPALLYARSTRDQSELGAHAREKNVRGAFQVDPQLRRWPRVLVVVDDIVTTGATAVEATRALRAAGGDVRAVSAVCATVLRRPVVGAALSASGGGS